MQIVPVLDILGGTVVHAVGGRRSEYRPLVSRLTDSTDPLTVAQAIRDVFGLSELYIADLDAILGRESQGVKAEIGYTWLERLRTAGFLVWLDAGIRVAADAERLGGVETIILGSETTAGPHVMRETINRYGPERIAFSLDLSNSRMIGDTSAWGSDNSTEVAAMAVAAGVRRLIVLDIARVGLNSGTGTESLCAEFVQRWTHVAVYAGGGIREADDLQALESVGVSGALIASALHDGRDFGSFSRDYRFRGC